MERKFRITRAKEQSGDKRYIGEVIIMKEDGSIRRPYVGRVNDGCLFGSGIQYVKEHYEIEEITEPRIELKCVGFEEGDRFKVRGYASTHFVRDGKLRFDCSDGSTGLSGISTHDLYDVKLIQKQTEEDKQIAELKETIEEAMRKIEEIEKARENPITTN